MKLNKYKIEKYSTMINLFTAFMTMAVQMLVNFILSPYIVKTLGEEANGFTQLANNFVNYASLITITFNSMASRFISVNYHRGEIKKAKEYYSSIIVCDIIILLILLPISCFVVYNIDNLIDIGKSDISDIRLLFSCVFLNFFANQIIALFTMSLFVQNKIYLQNVMNFIRNILNAILLLCFFSILPAKMYFVSFSALILTTISLPFYIFFKNKLLSNVNFEKDLFRLKAVGELIKSGIWNTVNQCGNMLMTGFDLLLANLLVSPSEMGVLSIAKIIPNAIISLGAIINSSFAPELTISWATGKAEDVLKKLEQSVKISTIIMSIPLASFSVFSLTFYKLWQPNLDSKSLAILSILTFSSFFLFSGTHVLYNIFQTTNKLAANSVSFIISGILNFIIVFLLLKFTDIGIYAVAGVSQAVAAIRGLFFILPYSAKLLNYPWHKFFRFIGYSCVVMILNAAISFGLMILIKPSSWIMLIIAVGLSCLVQAIVDIFVILNKEEKRIVLERMHIHG